LKGFSSVRVISDRVGLLEFWSVKVISERDWSVRVERVLEVKSGRCLLLLFNWPPGPVKEKFRIYRYFVLPVSVKKFRNNHLQVMY